jgi:hypothetical protein
MVQRAAKVVAAIEIKYSPAPVLKMGFHVAMEDRSMNNYVIVPVGESYRPSAHVKVASLQAFLTHDLPKL